MPSPFPCSPVIRESSSKKKKKKKNRKKQKKTTQKTRNLVLRLNITRDRLHIFLTIVILPGKKRLGNNMYNPLKLEILNY